MSFSGLTRIWERSLKAANRESEIEISLTMHLLRHTYAAGLYNAGVPIKTAQYWMGHKDLKVPPMLHAPGWAGQDADALA